MKYITKDVSDIFTLHGSFALLSGEPVATDGGFEFEGNGLKLTANITKHPSGVVCRRDTVKNISDKPITISSALSKFVFNGGEHEVYTQRSVWCGERYGAWQPLVTEICAANDEIRHNAGAAPFTAVYNLQNGRGMAFHVLADGKWRLRVRNFYSQSGSRKNLTVELGLDDSDLRAVLSPDEELQLPTVLFYSFTSKNDMDAYKLHRYCRDVYPTPSLPVIYNTWMSKFDNISYDILSEQLEAAKHIGAEYFVIDAGWFGRPNVWFDSVGDWEECADASMAGRMKEFADKVHSYGLGFGVWFEIERASLNSRAYAEHPERYLVEDGYAFVNFGDADVCRHILDTVSSQIEKYGVDFIKFDFNATLTYDADGLSFMNFFKGYRGFIRDLRQRFPSLYLENCASGGLRMALSNLDGFDSFWMSDDHSLYNQLEIFKNTLRRMPSNMLEKWITIGSIAPFEPLYGGGTTEKILMSGDAGWDHVETVNKNYLESVAVGGPIGISCDLTKLSDDLTETLRKLISEHKAERSFWAESECRILCDTPTLTVLQYSDSAQKKIKLFTFSSLPLQNSVTVYPVVDESAEYICSDGTTVSGAALAENGVDMFISVRRYNSNKLTLTAK